MAMSNWDLMAVDTKGNPTDGKFKSPAGVEVEIYKNWVYVKDEKAWTEKGAQLNEPYIMQLSSGVLSYKDIDINAIRGPQNGIFIIVEHSKFDKKKKEYVKTGMAGCGVSAFAGNRGVGVTQTSLKFLEKLIKEEKEGESIFPLNKAKRFNQGDAFFIGAKKSSTKIGKAKQSILGKVLLRMS